MDRKLQEGINRNYLPYIAGVNKSIIFGFCFMFTKILLNHFDIFSMLAVRFALAAITLTILYLFGKIKVNYRGKNMKGLILLSFIEPVIYFILETIGIRYTSSSEAGIMMAIIPIFIILLSIVFLHEVPSKKETLFITLSIFGVIFIALMGGQSGEKGSLLGYVSMFLAMIVAALYNILSRKLSDEFSPTEITFAMMWIGAISFSIISIVYHGGVEMLPNILRSFSNIKVFFSLVYLGIIASIVAFFLNNYMLAKITAAQSSVYINLSTVVSILAGVFILKEKFYWYEFVGSILILIGVWGTNYFGMKEKIRR